MNSTSIVVLTGAGISAESGIKTFRGNGGLWEDYPIEKIATTKGYKRNPKLVLDFYNARRAQVLSPWVRPNAAHLALAQLERTFPDAVTIITQNIDSLHEKGGSENILHMHGDLSKVRCTYCNTIYECYKNIDLEI